MAGQYKFLTQKQFVDVYDEIVTNELNFVIMKNKVAKLAQGMTLEVGAGTGFLTAALLKNKNIKKLIIIEPNSFYVKKFRQTFPKIKILKRSGLTYTAKKKFDCIVMTLVYHHIRDAKKMAFLKNLYGNLKKGGKLILGEIFVLPYDNNKERDESFKIFYEQRIKTAPTKLIKRVEKIDLQLSLKRKGEWKTSYEVMKAQIEKIGFRKIMYYNIGLQKTGGCKVVIAIK